MKDGFKRQFFGPLQSIIKIIVMIIKPLDVIITEIGLIFMNPESLLRKIPKNDQKKYASNCRSNEKKRADMVDRYFRMIR